MPGTISLVHIVLDVSRSMSSAATLPRPPGRRHEEAEVLEGFARWLCEEARGAGGPGAPHGLTKACLASAGLGLFLWRLASMPPSQLLGSRYISISTMGYDEVLVAGPWSVLDVMDALEPLRDMEPRGGEFYSTLARGLRKTLGLDLVRLSRLPQASEAPTDACHIIRGLDRVLGAEVFRDAGKRYLLVACYSDCCINAHSCPETRVGSDAAEALVDLRAGLDRVAARHRFSPPLVVAILAGDPKLVGLESGACPFRAMAVASPLGDFRVSGFPGARELAEALSDEDLFYLPPGIREWPYTGGDRLSTRAVRFLGAPAALAQVLARITTAGTRSSGG